MRDRPINSKFDSNSDDIFWSCADNFQVALSPSKATFKVDPDNSLAYPSILIEAVPKFLGDLIIEAVSNPKNFPPRSPSLSRPMWCNEFISVTNF